MHVFIAMKFMINKVLFNANCFKFNHNRRSHLLFINTFIHSIFSEKKSFMDYSMFIFRRIAFQESKIHS